MNRSFIAWLLSLILTPYIFSQQELEITEPLVSDSTYSHYGSFELIKVHNENGTYNLKFKHLKKPDSGNSNERYSVDLINSKGESTDVNLSQPYAALVYSLDSNSQENDFVEVKIFLPKAYFSIHSEKLSLNLYRFHGNKLMSKIQINIIVKFEIPEFLSLNEWQGSLNPNVQVIRVVDQVDHLVVYSHHRLGAEIDQHKVKLRAYEKFVFETPLGKSKPTLGIINVPIKVRRSAADVSSLSQVNLSNLGLHFGLFNFNRHSFHAHGAYTHESFGIGAFVLPSLQRVRFVQNPESALQSLSVNPFQASFFGFGMTLNYSYNGLSLSLIPLGIDFQTSADQPYTSIHDRKVWIGLGIGYTPRNWILKK